MRSHCRQNAGSCAWLSGCRDRPLTEAAMRLPCSDYHGSTEAAMRLPCSDCHGSTEAAMRLPCSDCHRIASAADCLAHQRAARRRAATAIAPTASRRHAATAIALPAQPTVSHTDEPRADEQRLPCSRLRRAPLAVTAHRRAD